MKALQIIDKRRNGCWFRCKRTKDSKNYNHLKNVLGKNRMWKCLQKKKKKCLQKRKSCSVTSKKDWCWSWSPVFLSSDVNSWLIGKVPDAGKHWGQKEKRVSEDEMAGWHHWCNGHELTQTYSNDEGQGGLVWCSPWGCKDWDITKQQQLATMKESM